MANNPPETGKTNKAGLVLTAVSIILFVGFILLIIMGWLRNMSPLLIWGVIALVMILLLVGLGLLATNNWYGVIVEKSRNRASLSRLQMTLWTVLIISAFLSIAFTRTFHPLKMPSAEEVAVCKAEYIANAYGIDLSDLEGEIPQSEEAINLEQALTEAEEECNPQPLKIVFPEEVLLVLGISTASFAGSSLIKSNKRKKPSAETTHLQSNVIAAQQALNNKIIVYAADKSIRLGRAAERIVPETIDLEDAQRKLAMHKDEGLLCIATEPKLTDIFFGDQEGDCDFIDLGKVQMFFITVSILVAYGVAIGALMMDLNLVLATFGVDFPLISSSMATLLAISHAGYLTVKAPDRPETP